MKPFLYLFFIIFIFSHPIAVAAKGVFRGVSKNMELRRQRSRHKDKPEVKMCPRASGTAVTGFFPRRVHFVFSIVCLCLPHSLAHIDDYCLQSLLNRNPFRGDEATS